MTDTRTAVDNGIHAWKMAFKMVRGSLDRKTYAGRLMPRALVIFSTCAGSLDESQLGACKRGVPLVKLTLCLCHLQLKHRILPRCFRVPSARTWA